MSNEKLLEIVALAERASSLPWRPWRSPGLLSAEVCIVNDSRLICTTVDATHPHRNAAYIAAACNVAAAVALELLDARRQLAAIAKTADGWDGSFESPECAESVRAILGPRPTPATGAEILALADELPKVSAEALREFLNELEE